MKQGPSYIDTIGLSLLHKAVSMGTLLLSLLVAGLFIYLADKYGIGSLKVVATIVFLTGLFLSIFTCGEIIAKMRQDKAMLFSDAVKHTFYGYLTLLCFVPIVGSITSRMVRKENPRNPFIADKD